MVKQYTTHKCSGYSITAHMFGHDDYLVTGMQLLAFRLTSLPGLINPPPPLLLLGSEDNHLYVYDVKTGEVLSCLPAGQSVIHVVAAHPNVSSPTLVSSSVDTVRNIVLYLAIVIDHLWSRDDKAVDCSLEIVFRWQNEANDSSRNSPTHRFNRPSQSS